MPVDVCLLRDVPSVFLQQAAHITQGCYVAVADPTTLLQVLLVQSGVAGQARARGEVGQRIGGGTICARGWA